MQENNDFCTSYLTKFSNKLGGIWYTVETCRCDERHIYFISVSLVFKGDNPTLVIFLNKKLNIGLYSDIYRPISFKHGIMVGPLSYTV